MWRRLVGTEDPACRLEGPTSRCKWKGQQQRKFAEARQHSVRDERLCCVTADTRAVRARGPQTLAGPWDLGQVPLWGNRCPADGTEGTHPERGRAPGPPGGPEVGVSSQMETPSWLRRGREGVEEGGGREIQSARGRLPAAAASSPQVTQCRGFWEKLGQALC